MLAAYYDKTQKNSFEDTFGDLYIGKNSTRDRNSLLVLLFDFSSVGTQGDYDSAEKDLNRVIYSVLDQFLKVNAAFLGDHQPAKFLVKDSAAESLERVIVSTTLYLAQNHTSPHEQQYLVKDSGQRLFVGVDEYDAPAKSWLFSSTSKSQEMQCHQVAELFNTKFFAIMKIHFGEVIQKYWLTGVLPVFRDGPLGAVQIISTDLSYHDICGLTEEEVRTISSQYLHSKFNECQVLQQLAGIKRWYSEHRFCPSSNVSLYNPQLVFTHLHNTLAGFVHSIDEAIIHSSSIFAAIFADGNRIINVNDLLKLMAQSISWSI